MSRLLPLVLLLGAGIAAAQEPGHVRHPLLAAQPASEADGALLLVEIPTGNAIKYEVDADGHLFVDRFLSMPVAYPANYGSMPRSLAGDGDPLDALILTRAPLHPGVLVQFRPIGVLRMVDAGEQDQKIIGVPTDKLDPAYSSIRDIGDLPRAERDRIEAFFRVYKALSEEGNPVRLDGYGDAEEAKALISGALERFTGRAEARK